MLRRSLIRMLSLVPSVGLIFPKEAAAEPVSAVPSHITDELVDLKLRTVDGTARLLSYGAQWLKQNGGSLDQATLNRVIRTMYSASAKLLDSVGELPQSEREKATELFLLHYNNAFRYRLDPAVKDKLVAISVAFGGEYESGGSYQNGAIRIPL